MATNVRIPFALVLLALAVPAIAQDASISYQTSECLDCHEYYHPGIVADWKASRHARITPAAALDRPPLERRVSNPDVPLDLRPTTVGCYECHGLNAEAHADNFEHFGYQINVVVSPTSRPPAGQTCSASAAPATASTGSTATSPASTAPSPRPTG